MAEKANISTQYLAMIELTHKFPSPEKLEQIAAALEIDTPELFSMPPSVKISALKLQRSIIIDLEKAVEENLHQAIKSAVSNVVTSHLKCLENNNTNSKPKNIIKR